MKKCSQCKVEKDGSEFSKNKSRWDGLNPICKLCCKENSKNRYIKNKEKINAATKAYYEANKEKISAYFKLRKEAHPENRKSYFKKYYLENKEKIGISTKKYYKSNTERVKALCKAYYEANPEKTFVSKLKNRYSMNLEDYYLLLEQQGGVCAICGKTCITNERLSVDHNHHTGKVRGLLCRTCNLGIGHLQDSPEIVMKALEYLKSHLDNA